MTSRDSDVIDALAWDVVAFMRDVDQFSYDDAFDSFEDGVEQTRTLLAGGISRSDVTDTIRSLIDDDALLDEVFAEFCNQYEDFEDADEAALLDGDGE